MDKIICDTSAQGYDAVIPSTSQLRVRRNQMLLHENSEDTGIVTLEESKSSEDQDQSVEDF